MKKQSNVWANITSACLGAIAGLVAAGAIVAASFIMAVRAAKTSGTATSGIAGLNVVRIDRTADGSTAALLSGGGVLTLALVVAAACVALALGARRGRR